MKRQLRIQSLESRRLLTTELIHHLWPIGETPVVVADRAYSVSTTTEFGRELTSSRLTSNGTQVEVHDLAPGPESSDPGSLLRVGDHLVFLTCIGPHEIQVWVTDADGATGTFRQLHTFGSTDHPHPQLSVLGATDSAVVIREKLSSLAGAESLYQTRIIPIDGSGVFDLGTAKPIEDREIVVGQTVVVQSETDTTGERERYWVTDGTASRTQEFLRETEIVRSEMVAVGSGVGLVGWNTFGREFGVDVQRVDGEIRVSFLNAQDSQNVDFAFMDHDQGGYVLRDGLGWDFPVIINEHVERVSVPFYEWGDIGVTGDTKQFFSIPRRLPFCRQLIR